MSKISPTHHEQNSFETNYFCKKWFINSIFCIKRGRNLANPHITAAT